MENRNSQNVNVAEKSPFTSKNTIKFVCKFATLVAIAILVAMTTDNALLAVPPTPPPDCPNDTFKGPDTAKIYIGKCEFIYTYWWRFACGAFYDTYIESVKLIKGNDDYCAKIFADQYKKIIDAVMADIVGRQNPWKVEDLIPICSTTNTVLSPTQWRFFRPSCRTKEPVVYWDCCIGELVMEYMRCESTGYCYKTYRYCWKEDGNKRILQSHETGSGAFGNIGCEPIIINKEIRYDCIPTCDEE